MKNYKLIALIVLIVIQLCTPAYMVANKNHILKNGTEVKFEVRPFDPYDPFRGRYVSIRPEIFSNNAPRNNPYGIIQIDENGYAKIVSTQQEKPTGEIYVKSKNKNYFSLPIDRYYMDEKLAPKAERVTQNRSETDKIYVTARILNGSLVVSGLYVNDIPIEEYVTK